MEQRKPRNNGPRNNGPKKGQRNNGTRREEKEFEERVVTINRVTKVVKGGRKFRFAALVVICLLYTSTTIHSEVICGFNEFCSYNIYWVIKYQNEM